MEQLFIELEGLVLSDWFGMGRFFRIAGFFLQGIEMNPAYNIDIPMPRENFITLSDLKALPAFGSLEWSKVSFDIGTKALFIIGTSTKEGMFDLSKEEGKAVIVETIAVKNGVVQLYLKSMYVIIDE